MFASVESALLDVVVKINTYLSNYILVFLLVAVGLWYSIRPASSRSAASAKA